MSERITRKQIDNAFHWMVEAAVGAGIEGAREWVLEKRFGGGNPYIWTVWVDNRCGRYLWGDRYYTSAELVAKMNGVEWACEQATKIIHDMDAKQ